MFDSVLALEEAKGAPGVPICEAKPEFGDPRYPKKDWMKKQYLHRPLNGKKAEQIDIHYWEYRQTGYREKFKFKDW